MFGFEIVLDDNIPAGTILFGSFRYYGVNIPQGVAVEVSRERAITTLYNQTRRFAEWLDLEAERGYFIDEESAQYLQTYAPAEIALLQLLKEESEEMNHD